MAFQHHRNRHQLGGNIIRIIQRQDLAGLPDKPFNNRVRSAVEQALLHRPLSWRERIYLDHAVLQGMENLLPFIGTGQALHEVEFLRGILTAWENFDRFDDIEEGDFDFRRAVANVERQVLAQQHPPITEQLRQQHAANDWFTIKLKAPTHD